MSKVLEEAKERFEPIKGGFTYLRVDSEIPVVLSSEDIEIIRRFAEYRKSSWFVVWLRNKLKGTK